MEEGINRETLEHLFATDQINLRRAGLFQTIPAPLPPDFDFERIEGMMLGLAIADALGSTTEGLLPQER